MKWVGKLLLTCLIFLHYSEKTGCRNRRRSFLVPKNEPMKKMRHPDVGYRLAKKEVYMGWIAWSILLCWTGCPRLHW